MSPSTRLFPGFSPLARGLATGEPDVTGFLPDPCSLDAVRLRASLVLERFHARTARPADSRHARLLAGLDACVVTGQQVGVLTGPLLTLVKAIAAVKLAEDAGLAPAFWCASEDHDLVEVTRLAVPGPDGPREIGPDPEPLAASRRPVGQLPIPLDLDAVREAFLSADPGAEFPRDLADLVDLHRGRTFHDAFVAAMIWFLEGDAPVFLDAARREDKPDVVPLACRIVRERKDVSALLDERARQLVAAGYRLQVTTDPAALPLFAIAGGERRLLLADGGALVLKGDPGGTRYAPDEVVDRFESGEWLPSFSALTRPLVASLLVPVAATVLGPAEIAYWAQSYPLFAWAGIVPPVIVPRPLVALLDPARKKLLEKAGVSVFDLLDGPEALVSRHGASQVRPLLDAVSALRDGTLDGLEARRDALVALDPTLGKALDSTKQNAAFAFGKLLERASAAAGRADQEFATRAGRLASALVPGGTLAERVYSPAPFVLSLGRERLVSALRSSLRWDRPGLQVIES